MCPNTDWSCVCRVRIDACNTVFYVVSVVVVDRHVDHLRARIQTGHVWIAFIDGTKRVMT